MDTWIVSISFVLFFATLGLCCCSRPFSNCKKQGLPSSCSARTSHCSGLSCFRARVLGRVGFSNCSRSVVAAHGLHCPWGCCPSESSWTRDWTRVLCIGRRFPNHWTSSLVSTFWLLGTVWLWIWYTCTCSSPCFQFLPMSRIAGPFYYVWLFKKIFICLFGCAGS